MAVDDVSAPTVVVGVDGSPEATAALRWAADEARLRRADLLVCHATGRGDAPDAMAALELLDDVIASVEGLDGQVVHRQVLRDTPPVGLADAAREAELLVVGRRGTGGFADLVLGSTAEHCVAHATVPVAVVPADTPTGAHGRVVVGVDGSRDAELALHWAVDEAALRGSAVDVVGVHEQLRPRGAVASRFQETSEAGGHARFGVLLEQAARETASAVANRVAVTSKVLAAGRRPAEVLLEHAQGADLLVIGGRGRGGLSGLLLGSVTQHLLRSAPCPVVVVREVRELAPCPPPEDADAGPFTCELRDGSVTAIRPISPQDKWRLAEGLRRLSPRSRYLRFHSGVDELSDAQLRYLTEVDQRDHVAWVATDPAAPHVPGMGVARYVRLADEPAVAEAAVTVADEYQARGLGTILLGVLARSAAANGIRTFRNYVLADNEGMLRLLEDLGATRTDEGGGVFRVDVPVPADPEEAPDTAAGRLFKAAATRRLSVLMT